MRRHIISRGHTWQSPCCGRSGMIAFYRTGSTAPLSLSPPFAQLRFAREIELADRITPLTSSLVYIRIYSIYSPLILSRSAAGLRTAALLFRPLCSARRTADLASASFLPTSVCSCAARVETSFAFAHLAVGRDLHACGISVNWFGTCNVERKREGLCLWMFVGESSVYFVISYFHSAFVYLLGYFKMSGVI